MYNNFNLFTSLAFFSIRISLNNYQHDLQTVLSVAAIDGLATKLINSKVPFFVKESIDLLFKSRHRKFSKSEAFPIVYAYS